MFIANQHFGDYRKGDEVPADLPNNNERLQRGLIREIKVAPPIETKRALDDELKSKAKAKQSK